MKKQLMIDEIDWSLIPIVAELAEARAWLTFQACRGLARNTLDAYGSLQFRLAQVQDTVRSQLH